MKILTYTSLFPNSAATNHGVFTQNRMFPYAQRHGHELRVVAPVPYFPQLRAFKRWYGFSQVPHQEVWQGVPVSHPRYVVTPKIGMPLYGWSMLLGTRPAVHALQRQFDFSVIDSHFLYPDGFAAVLLGQRLGKPVVVTAHGKDINSYSQMLCIRPLIKLVLQRATAVISVCQAMKDKMVRLGIPSEKIHVIGNGADLRHFYPADQAAARRRLGLPLDKKILLSVAQLIERKGIHHLVEAAARLKQQHSELLVAVVGNQNDAAYTRRISQQIAQNGLGDIVRLIGEVPHSGLGDWYNASDLFCLCSSREGMPCVLFEAMSCGKPVVASAVDGIPEVIHSTQYGLLVDSQTGEAFARAFDAALKKQWDTETIVRYAQENSWDALSAKQHYVFDKAAAPGW